MRIGVLGTGTIASAVVRSVADDGHSITVSRRSAAVSAALARDHASVSVAENQGVIDASEVILLGLTADAAPRILDGLRFRPDQRVLSLMGGAGLDQVAELVAPAATDAVMIPFPSIAQDGSPILVLGRRDLVESIFGLRNKIFCMKDEAELHAFLCAQAVLSPVARLVEEAAAWLASHDCDAETGEAFLRRLVVSSLSNMSTADLLKALDTEGGYNQRLRQHMDQAGMGPALRTILSRLKAEI